MGERKSGNWEGDGNAGYTDEGGHKKGYNDKDGKDGEEGGDGGDGKGEESAEHEECACCTYAARDGSPLLRVWYASISRGL